eukprot:4416913-Amphidinium_carterae.3
MTKNCDVCDRILLRTRRGDGCCNAHANAPSIAVQSTASGFGEKVVWGMGAFNGISCALDPYGVLVPKM